MHPGIADAPRLDAPWTIPAHIAEAFAGHATLGMPAVVSLLEMDVKTLVRHCDGGDIGFRYKGTGRLHRRRVFTLADVMGFLTRLAEVTASGTAECRSTATRARAFGTSTSRSRVIAFPGPLAAKMNVTRRPSRTRKGSKPGGSLKPPSPPEPGPSR